MKWVWQLLSCALVLVPARMHAEEDAFPLVTKRVQGWVDRGYYPGCSVWIAKGDKVLYQKNFGTGTADTEVYIASSGKWLAAAAILAVVDEGKLSLDDQAEKWLPEFKGDPKGKATIRQMLSHTSGYPPYQPKDKPNDGYQTCAESVAHLLPLPPLFKPGEQFEYGGLAMQTAGRMAELATGKDWETIFREKIARPLGMTRTRFTPVDAGHTPMLAGAALSTLSDYQKFLTLIDGGGVFEGKRILSEHSVREMQADQIRDANVKREEFVERTRGNTHRGVYGLGMWREELDAAGNATLMSSPSWAGTYPWIDRKTGIRGMIIAHVEGPNVARDGFSGFWTSPVLAKMVRAQLGWEKPSSLPHFEEGIIPADGADLAYEAAGAGEPVILLHAHSLDRRMWDPQFAELAKHYRVIRYDLRGYGLSDLPTEGRDFSHAADLLALMERLRIPKAHLIGLSLGAFVVTDFLALHPERVMTATIASGGAYAGPGSRTFVLDDAAKAKILAGIEALRKEGMEAEKYRWLDHLVGTAGPRAETVRPALAEMIGDWSAWQPLHIEPPHVLGAAALDLLAKTPCDVPVELLAGANDPNVIQSFGKFTAVLPHAQIHILPDTGHLLNMERPAAFLAQITDFISSNTTHQHP
jgi:CubicO group peptidase (beta-lactamase class C family)/pimeloyl-ACP methyl ester carboxylesterase